MSRSFFPNLITCLNLSSGCVAIVLTAQGDLVNGAKFILLSGLFDFLDGMVARLVKGASPLGVQLDSLADMVTFGFYPGFLMYQLISISTGNYHIAAGEREGAGLILPFAGFLLTIFACLRLAIFNLSTDQKSTFRGIPTPAMTMMILFIPGIIATDLELNELNDHSQASLSALSGYHFIELAALLYHPVTLVIFTLILAFLMVSPLRFISLKFSGGSVKNFIPILIVAIPSVVLIVWLYGAGYYYLQWFFIMIWYTLTSVLITILKPDLYEVYRRN